MRRFAWLVLTFAFLLLGSGAGLAVQPDEVLPDAALESRARAISSELRCMVCQNQSIDDSDAELARDLRVLVRERLVAGDSDRQVVDYIVSRYGEFVLLKPRFSVRNAALWLAPFALLLLGAFYLAVRGRGPRGLAAVKPLEDEEKERLKNVLGR